MVAAAAEWVNKKLSIKSATIPPKRLRWQTLAALDALGPEAKSALPALEILLEENPPDPDALYVIARIGEPGVPLLERSLTNSTSSEAKLLRLEARCLLGMMASNSSVLYPPASDPDAQGYSLRICEFHTMTMGAAFREYLAEHPEARP
jgi:HEAT repeat protein